MADAATKSVDAAVFSTRAADATHPGGLLAGVSALTATTPGASDLEAAATDVAALAAEIASAGIDPTDMVLVAAWPQAVKLKLLSGPNFNNAILGTNALADGTIVGIAPAGIAVGDPGTPPEVEVSKEAAVHFEDTSPQPISIAGSPNVVSAPVRSAFQQNLLVVRVRARCAWASLPGSVQFMTGVGW